MPGSKLIILAVVFFVTSVVSVVSGSTSLITVPVLIAFGIEPHLAVATNMMALILMSAGGSLPFTRKRVVQRRILPVGIILTVIGSAIGALLLVHIPTRALQLTIAVAMIAVGIFSVARQDGDSNQRPVSRPARATGYMLTLILAVYGGFFSGGYVTMLTAVLVFSFGMTFLQAVATTKVINIFSSLVATAIFASRGVVDYRLGAVLGATMFLGAVVGGSVAMQLPATWLRRVFLIAVVVLALKMLLDLIR